MVTCDWGDERIWVNAHPRMRTELSSDVSCICQFWGLGVIYIILPTVVSIVIVVIVAIVITVVIVVIIVIPSCKSEALGWTLFFLDAVWFKDSKVVPLRLYLTRNPKPNKALI